MAQGLSLSLSGAQLCGLYLLLEEREELLDDSQSSAMAALRAAMYERLTVEQMESLGSAYRALKKAGSH